MKDIYCISGVGADERIFMRLKLRNARLIHIPWPEFDEHDGLDCYAQKISSLIKGENPIIMGVSMGGMLSVEIAKTRPVEKLILISSAKTKEELPPYNGLFGRLMKSQIIPAPIYKMPNPLMMDRFGAENADDEAMLKAILKDTDAQFMKWAMKAIALWENHTYEGILVTHIHGRQDKMIFPGNVNADYWIEDGGHMMIYNRAKEISPIIEKELQLV